MIKSTRKVPFSVSSRESECIKIFGADLVQSLENVFIMPFAFSHKTKIAHFCIMQIF